MTDLTPEARRTLIAARAASEPSADDRERNRAAMLAAIAASASVAAAAGHASAQAGVAAGAKAGLGATTASFGSLLGLKLGAGLVGVALVVGGGLAWTQRPAANPAKVVTASAPASRARQPAVAAAAPVAQAQATEPPVAAPPSGALPAAEPGEAPAVEAHAARPRQLARVTLSEELELVSQAEAALARHDERRALSLLDKHARSFPRGQLRQERQGLRAIALCTLQADAAAALGHAFLEQHPSSVLAARVHHACVARSNRER